MNGLKADVHHFNLGLKTLEHFLDDRDCKALAYIFLPCIGTKIREYRSWLLSELKKWDKEVEKIWNAVSVQLYCLENKDFSDQAKNKRIKFYRMDIDTALKKYC